MADPSLALQAAVIQVLKGDSGIDGLVGDRVYDRVPKSAIKPYIVYGSDQVLRDDIGDCGEGWEVFISIHAWSESVGQPQVKRIGSAIVTALHNSFLDLTSDFRLVDFQHNETRYLRDPDGLSTQAIVEFRALVDGETAFPVSGSITADNTNITADHT